MMMKQSIGAKTIVFPTPVFIVGSYDEAGRPNIMNVAWGGICCSKPPCVAIALREATYTFSNIARKGAFTVNIPSVHQVKEADYAGLCSGRDRDKFAELGLTPTSSELVDAPYIEEFPLVLECKVTHMLKLGLHTQFIGEIMDVKADPGVLDANGFPDITKVEPFCFSPSNQGYYRIGEFIGQAFLIGGREK